MKLIIMDILKRIPGIIGTIVITIFTFWFLMTLCNNFDRALDRSINSFNGLDPDNKTSFIYNEATAKEENNSYKNQTNMVDVPLKKNNESPTTDKSEAQEIIHGKNDEKNARVQKPSNKNEFTLNEYIETFYDGDYIKEDVLNLYNESDLIIKDVYLTEYSQNGFDKYKLIIPEKILFYDNLRVASTAENTDDFLLHKVDVRVEISGVNLTIIKEFVTHDNPSVLSIKDYKSGNEEDAIIIGYGYLDYVNNENKCFMMDKPTKEESTETLKVDLDGYYTSNQPIKARKIGNLYYANYINE